jgi:hypothetical protein
MREEPVVGRSIDRSIDGDGLLWSCRGCLPLSACSTRHLGREKSVSRFLWPSSLKQLADRWVAFMPLFLASRSSPLPEPVFEWATVPFADSLALSFFSLTGMKRDAARGRD